MISAKPQTTSEFLSSVLSDRMLRNRRYSLRAFAKHLELSPSHLSAVLKGKKRLSLDSAVSIAKKLALTQTATKSLLEMVQSDAARTPEAREYLSSVSSSKRIPRTFFQANGKSFDLLSLWYLIPIIALSEVLPLSEKVVVSRLGISAADRKSVV